MDPITHGLLGSTLTQLCLFKKDKANAWIIGGLAAMAPDLDFFIRSEANPLLLFQYHRQFTHSLLFIPFGALIVTLVLMAFKRFRSNWQWTFFATLIGFSTHGLLDTCTNYGTVLFWPFTYNRLHWDVVSIIDPWVSLPLFIGLFWSKLFNTSKSLWISLLFVGLFFIANTIQHSRALNALEEYAFKNQIKMTKARAFPKLASSRHWSGVALTDNKLIYFAITTPLLYSPKLEKLNQYPLLNETQLPDYVKDSSSLMHDLTLFRWFTDDFLFVVQENPLTLGDGRFIIRQRPTQVLWSIRFHPGKEHVVMH